MSDTLELCFIPPLILLIINAQTQKGRPLTQEEVESIRDSATCIALPIGSNHQMAEQRGYQDFDPDNVWRDYLESHI